MQGLLLSLEEHAKLCIQCNSVRKETHCPESPPQHVVKSHVLPHHDIMSLSVALGMGHRCFHCKCQLQRCLYRCPRASTLIVDYHLIPSNKSSQPLWHSLADHTTNSITHMRHGGCNSSHDIQVQTACVCTYTILHTQHINPSNHGQALAHVKLHTSSPQ